MNQLLPIIRRVRRPLLVADTPPVMVGNVEPVPASAATTKTTSVPGLVPPASDTLDSSAASACPTPPSDSETM